MHSFMCIYFLILQFYVFHLNSFENFFVCEEVLNHKEKGQVFTQSTLNSGDCILILHVLSFLECGLQIKKRYLSKFFFFFARVLWFLRNDPSKLLLLLPG